MERLTNPDTNKVCFDPWELCGLDKTCTRECIGCKLPAKIRLLAAYEDTGLTPAEITAMQAENHRLKEQADSAYMDGVRYAIYEIMKEADVYGSQTIRDSGDTADGMCEQAVRLITADLTAYRQAEAEGRIVRVVRCKDCMYANTAKSHPQLNCQNQNSTCYKRRVRGNWYCMDGESALAALKGEKK